jgi:lipopolysaccharide/colanic/teichoic acid biosynthesis glycosyltransferase
MTVDANRRLDSFGAVEVMAPPAPAAGFYATRGKRWFDFTASGLGLLLLSPLLIVVAILVKLTSRGPALYRQVRVGRRGELFRIAKFRTLREHAGAGRQITAADDPRITPIGSVLRRFKLDELPQLWNVLAGDMSLVGPRPEVPYYVARYSDAQRQVLNVRPGITDPASIAYRHEETLLAGHTDPDAYYRQVILPDKLEMNLDYVEHICLSVDLVLLLRTIGTVFFSDSISRAR